MGNLCVKHSAPPVDSPVQPAIQPIIVVHRSFPDLSGWRFPPRVQPEESASDNEFDVQLCAPSHPFGLDNREGHRSVGQSTGPAQRCPLVASAATVLVCLFCCKHMIDDPFDQSLADVRIALSSAESSLAKSKKLSNEVDKEELEMTLSGVKDEIDLLKNVVGALLTNNGKIRGKQLAPGVLTSRQQAVTDAEARLLALQRSVTQYKIPTSSSASSARAQNDDFVEQHLAQQMEELKVQDECLDRLQQGVSSLQEKGSLIRDELNEQEATLGALEGTMGRVHDALRSTNRRIDSIITKMSNTRRICLIVLLTIILMVLVFMLFK